MEWILTWLDKASNTYKTKIFEADTERKALNVTHKHFESLPKGSWDDPVLHESDKEQIKM